MKNAMLPIHQIVAASMATDITGAPVPIQFEDNVSIQLNFTGTPTGTFQIQGSLDYNPDTHTAGNFVSLTLSPAPIASGSSGNILLDLNQLSFPWIRITYTAVSGTGTLDAFVSCKSV